MSKIHASVSKTLVLYVYAMTKLYEMAGTLLREEAKYFLRAKMIVSRVFRARTFLAHATENRFVNY